MPIVTRPHRAKELGMSSTGPPFIPQIRYNLTRRGNRLTKLFYTDVDLVSQQMFIYQQPFLFQEHREVALGLCWSVERVWRRTAPGPNNSGASQLSWPSASLWSGCMFALWVLQLRTQRTLSSMLERSWVTWGSRPTQENWRVEKQLGPSPDMFHIWFPLKFFYKKSTLAAAKRSMKKKSQISGTFSLSMNDSNARF